ncbi:MAG: hypothetical protein ACTMUB_08700 [cyanobacterium endosymbiont of Rhopalodia musculus]|nr:hypothetical protein [cyanobacterium endosymbiont of Epithemia clementina EcSB]WGT68146.1 hypothetical protein P3F56_03485 [cyanobacterium endosymbiont of Epithemia clementina EcSB]
MSSGIQLWGDLALLFLTQKFSFGGLMVLGTCRTLRYDFLS